MQCLHCSQPLTLRQTTLRMAAPEGELGPASRVRHLHKQRTLLPGLTTHSVRAHSRAFCAPNMPGLNVGGLAILALPRFKEPRIDG